MKDFGIIYLNDKCTTIDRKGNRYKKFKSIITNEEYEVKTKRTELIQTYCVVNYDDKTILEYCDDINDDYNLIVQKLGLLNWSMKFDNKLDLDMYLIDSTPHRKHYKGNIISVDPIGCKDIDDAICLVEGFSDYEIHIHISDPSSFIPINSPLDNEIKNRNSSIYLNNVYHMLPDILSTDIISLIEKKERRAYTCIITIPNKFRDTYIEDIFINLEDIDFRFEKSTIIVDRNMSYEEFINDMNNSQYPENEYYRKLFNVGFNLYKTLNLDGEYDSHKMIEAYMLLCNMCAAKICRLKRASDGDSNYNMMTEYVLENKKHKMFDNYYTHFTSPIRRYVDIIVHRLILNPDSYTEIELTNLVKDINNKNKILKKVYNIYNLINLMEDNNEIEIKARIVYIQENNIKLICDGKILNVNIDYRLIDNQIISIIYDKESIKIIHNENEKIYKIHEEINLKIYFLKNEINPFKIILCDNYILI